MAPLPYLEACRYSIFMVTLLLRTALVPTSRGSRGHAATELVVHRHHADISSTPGSTWRMVGAKDARTGTKDPPTCPEALAGSFRRCDHGASGSGHRSSGDPG